MFCLQQQFLDLPCHFPQRKPPSCLKSPVSVRFNRVSSMGNDLAPTYLSGLSSHNLLFSIFQPHHPSFCPLHSSNSFLSRDSVSTTPFAYNVFLPHFDRMKLIIQAYSTLAKAFRVIFVYMFTVLFSQLRIKNSL